MRKTFRELNRQADLELKELSNIIANMGVNENEHKNPKRLSKRNAKVKC